MLVAALAMATLALLFGLVLRQADEAQRPAPAPPSTTTWTRRPRPSTTTTIAYPLEEPAKVAGEIAEDGADTVCAALRC